MKITKSQLRTLIKESVEEVLAESKFKTPKEAYEWADKNGPSDESRKVASKSPHYAFFYAKLIDKGPHEVTWKAVQTGSAGWNWSKAYTSTVGTPNTPLDPQ